MTKRLVKFNFEHSRSGSLSGLFVSTEEEVTDIIGSWVYFGEVLGKHSEVELDLKPEHFLILETEESTVEDLEKAAGSSTIVGYNPFDYLSDIDESIDLDEDQIALPR